MRWAWRSLTAVVVVATALVATTAATALEPAPGHFRGKTSQDRRAALRTRKDGSVRFVDLRWVAKCDSGSRWGVDATRWHDSGNGIEQDGTAFSDGGTYKEDGGGGYRARIRANMRGHFTNANRAEGKFHIVVDVRRHGHHVDWCRVKAHWHVKRTDD